MKKRETGHRERIEIVEMHLAGMTLEEIAKNKGINRYTARTWWRAYRDGGWEALQPKPRKRPVKGQLSTFDATVRYVALRLKKEHPNWGADLLLYKMRGRTSLAGKKLPARSTLAAYIKPYLERIKVRHRKILKRAVQKKVKASEVHVVWQMDFKGEEAVGSCGKVMPFMMVDVLSSAPLQTTLYTGRLGISWRTVQAELRESFSHWGLPDFIQMDRDPVFVGGTRLEWPGTLLLWLVGIAVYPIINDAGRPTQNAQVERQNRTWMDHVAIGAQYSTLAEAQKATDEARYDRLHHLPSRNPLCQGKAPLQACPQLKIARRSFQADEESTLFDFERVELYLSDWRWLRSVDNSGTFSLADRSIYLGSAYRQQAVEVVYDLDLHKFAAYTYDETRKPLRQFSLPVISPDYIMGKHELV
jgi:transposase-like protein